jgi:glycosyltransferase involved in cell wall biosynthesis
VVAPTVSVIIPTYNYARFVGDALRSVANQTRDDYEIIVVDDGSTDDTADIVRRSGVPVRYLKQANSGPSASRNAGIAAAQGSYLGFLDADDLWLPDKLAAQVPILDAQAEVGLVYADALFYDDASGRVAGTHADRFPHPSGRILFDLLFGNVVPSPTPLVRRAALERSGPFDTRFCGSEDWDLWIRIARDWEISYVPRPLATYRVHGSNLHQRVDHMKRQKHMVLTGALADPRFPVGLARYGRWALARLHADNGRLHFHQRDFEAARAELLQAGRLRPAALLDTGLAARLAICLLGSRAARRLAGRRPRRTAWIP